MNRIEQKLTAQANKPEESYALNPMDEVFKGELLEKAREFEEEEIQNDRSSTSAVVENRKLKKNKLLKQKKQKLGDKAEKKSLVSTNKNPKPAKKKLGLKIKKKSIVNKKKNKLDK